jgi:hypothetical protein
MLRTDNTPIRVHYSTTFDGGRTPVLCKSADLSTPATSDPRYVSCDACAAIMTAAQRAQREEQQKRYPS